MSRTITALFDTRAEAEAAKTRLSSASIDADNVRIVDQDSASSYTSSDTNMSSSTSGMSSGSMSSTGTSETHGFWAGLKDMFVPDEDRHSYNEGISRGGSLLYASVDDDDVDRTIDLLEQTGSVDMDEREKSWKNEGWAGYSPATMGSTDTAGMTEKTGTTGLGAASMGTTNTGNEERIQLAEEQLVVGKREVNRGGARIRSYVVEKPVTEQVTLREEHVNVERRPVDGKANAANLDTGALFQDRTIEMTETSEEAVVGKTARVTEELVVSKTSDQRNETISDTVRKTEVDIDDTGNRGGSAIGGLDRDRT